MDIITLGNAYLASTRPSILKKRKVENVFDAMRIIVNQMTRNNNNKMRVKARWNKKITKGAMR